MPEPRKKPKRQSRPKYWQPYVGGSLGLIPRRSLPGTCTGSCSIIDSAALARLAKSKNYQVLFEILLDVHPALKQAKSNALRLVFGEGKTRFVAYTEGTGGGGRDEQDVEATSEIEDFLKALPNEIGGIVGLQSALAVHGLAHGFTALEAVPGPRGTGLHRLWPVDPLTLALFRPAGDPDADLSCYQRQSGTGVPTSGWVQMPVETFKWAVIDGTPDNPYGAGLFSAAYSQALADFASNQDLRDAVHNAAWPRLDYEYDRDKMTARAVSLGLDNNARDEDGLTNLDKYIASQVGAVEEDLTDLLPDDNYVHSNDLAIKALAGGDFGGLDEVLKIERHRLVQSLDELPTLMGINDGSTQTYTSVEWGIRATKAAWLRDWVNTLIIWALELHFRLQGKRITVRALCSPVRASDAEADARTEAIKDRTEANRTRRGLQTLEDEAQNVTGTGLPEEPEAKARQDVAQSDTAVTAAAATGGAGAA